jgi:hypothetical protein
MESQVVNPPISNTGGDCPESVHVESSVDYLRGTVPIKNYVDAKILLEHALDVEFVLVKDKNGVPLSSGFYKYRFTTQQGVNVLAINRSIDETSVDQHALIDISSKGLKRISRDSQALLFSALFDLGFVPTRMDIALDDYSKTVSPQLAFAAARQGNKSGFRRFSYQEDDRKAGTFYAGVRGSNGGGKFLRIYDKHIQSDGIVDAVRVEIELSQEKVRDAFTNLVSLGVQHWDNLFKGILKVSFRFLHRENGQRACRAKSLSWWGWLFEETLVFSYTPIVRESCIERTRRWIVNQVSASMAMVAMSLSDQTIFSASGDLESFDDDNLVFCLMTWIVEGVDRLSERHLSMIRDYKRSPGSEPIPIYS